MKPETLLNFTGGMDSTNCLYNWLREHPNEKILVHHCHLKTFQGRAPFEAEACRKVLDWFRDRGMDNFEYVETTFDYGDLSRIIYDIEVIAFITSIIIRDRSRDIRRVMFTGSRDDHEQSGFEIRRKRSRDILNLVGRREVEFLVPNAHKPRKTVIEEIPAELRALVWYCRRPVDGSPCGQCHTCKMTEV